VIDNDGDGVIEPLAPDNDRVILVFGERRGGSHYYALDVSFYDEPELLWEIHPEAGGDFEMMGQSWSTPVTGKVRIGTENRWVVLLGGGYDENQDQDPVPTSDTMGRGIYVVDLLNGTLVKSFTALENPTTMTYCIPSDIAAVDTNDSGLIDRLYVGDTGNQMWRCDIGHPNPSSWEIKRIFDNSGNGRKVFYPPDVVLEHGYEMLFWGTGDRANPNETGGKSNVIIALKDRNPTIPLIMGDLVDVTWNLIQDGTDNEKAIKQSQLDSKDGWFINLEDNAGEKVLSPSLVYFGVVYLTTFTPTVGDPVDPCYVGVGTARLYALDYRTAAAELNFDTSSDELTKSDRSQIIGTAIPSGMVIAMIQGMGASYIGVGGGIFTSDLVNAAAITRIYWRQMF
jgi:type IV pilus assembly protein PilY1